MAGIHLTLGDVTFEEPEVPEGISSIVRAAQRAAGQGSAGEGARIEWQGRLRGATARTRAASLEAYAKSRQPVCLRLDGAVSHVTVARFEADGSTAEMPYSIECRAINPPEAPGTAIGIILAIGYGADYAKRRNSLILQAYVLAMLGLIVWLIGIRYYGFVRMNWVFIAAAALTIVVFGALLQGNSFTLQKLKESVFLTARTTAMVCWLFVGSAIFSSAFALLGGQAYVEQFVLSLGLSPWQFMLLAQFIIFLLGWPLEWTEIIIIFLPIFLPLLKQFGIDPLFFGVMVALNLQTSFLSPPVAMAPFYLKGVAPPQVTINEIFSGVMPYIWIVVLFMVLMYIFPGMALWLPDYWSKLP